jgi:anti-sigma-K factor RskA
MSDEAGHSGEGEGGNRTLVAEFALGLLEGAEHERVARLIAADPALREELRLWRTHFQSFDSEFADQPVPATAWDKLETRLFGSAAKPASSLWDSLILWRGLFAGALAVAVVAIGINVSRPLAPSPEEFAVQLVAALQSQEGSDVEFVAFYDSANSTVKLIGLSGAAVPDKDYELWYIKGDEPAVSMGVVPVDAKLEIPLDPETRAKFDEGTVLAVTLEQKGGSPTGVAQGPIVSVGSATRI